VTKTTRRHTTTLFLLGLFALALLTHGRVGAQPQSSPAPSASPSPAPKVERWSIHAQATDAQQYHGRFPAAYSGPQSLSAQPDTAKTVDATIFLGVRLWSGGAIYLNPELDQGFGLGFPGVSGMPYNGTFGAAGFPSGEAYKVGSDSSYGRVQRAFIRQTFNIGGEQRPVDADINQLADVVSTKRVTLTAGKVAVVDIFDDNAYAHDTKNDFLNWSIIDMGAFDYAADSWGYTYGIAAELNGARSAVRAGLFQLSVVPNQIAIEPQPFRQYSPVVEFEQRTSLLGGHPGTIKELLYGDDGYMGSYADALAMVAGTGLSPSTAAVRAGKHWKIGGGINVAQEIAPHVGLFARLSAMNGTYEAYEFSDIDRSISGGISVDGGLYHRPNDTFGLAAAMNDLSNPARRYFAAGGLGILVGDGALSYGAENVLETYYKVGLGKIAGLTLDYQRIVDPAYNTVRGPVSIYGLRYHLQY
jgi:high affinity Mn2+ porin